MEIRVAAFAFLLLSLPAFIGCSKKESDEARPEPTAVVDPSTAGSITGTVKFEGALPVFRPIDMSAEAACVQANPQPVTPNVVVLGEHGALAATVVYVKSGLGRYHFDTPKDPAVLDQKGCNYEPRVLALRTFQPFEVRNTDPLTHNVHPIPRENRPWNRSIGAGEAPYVTTFSHPELAVPVVCNIHPWMRAYLFVFDNPYFDVTTKSGTFELKNLPPGTYTIEAWHERFGTQDLSVSIAPKQSKSVAFTFRPVESH
ncbi:MAG TPA: carboxypeptidase regulatory-like domain-containing protein [Candidatus Acidoferrales bacterium]|nr:carboxypeptidase regulatory-like domain-containing protein [Candidatus Acidoferrales bacterium]